AGNARVSPSRGRGPEGSRVGLPRGAWPGPSRAPVLGNPANPGIAFYLDAIEKAGRALHVAVGPVVEVRRVEDLDGAFATVGTGRPDALALPADRSLLSHRPPIVGVPPAPRLPPPVPYRRHRGSA